MSRDDSLICLRGSTGIHFVPGPRKDGNCDGFTIERSSTCKDMMFTKEGTLFVWCNGQKVIVADTPDIRPVFEMEKSKVSCMYFSPKGTYLATWEPYTSKENQQESCNLHVWNIKKNMCIKSFIQKRQSYWHPQWTDDEYLCSRNVNNEVHFFEDNNFDQIARKIFIQKVSSFSISPGPPDYHVACYVPGVKGQPSFIRLYKYPTFEGSNAIIAQKSFFKAEKAEFYWHKQGKDLIVQATVDVDKSGKSYYGEQNLYYLSVKGDTAKIMLGKQGPIYSVEWNPCSLEFCVVYGYMPAKATIYNLKCEALFDFGTAPRNEIHYSPTGKKLLLAGFGNLHGHVEVWDVRNQKLICKFTATDSTCIKWGPEGEYILTATLSPRIRIGNGYRIWHYTGNLVREVFIETREELWEIEWKPKPFNKIQENINSSCTVPTIQTAVVQASKEVYRPPAAQGKPASFKLHDNEPPKSSEKSESKSQALSKNQKRNLARKTKKEQENQPSNNSEQEIKITNDIPASQVEITEMLKSVKLTGEPEKDKRIRNLLKRLDQIQKLKEEQNHGKHLEVNQIEKMNKEEELLNELRQMDII